MKCLICKKQPCDPCHIASRGSGGKDEDWNLINLCRIDHTIQHSMGWAYMWEKFVPVRIELKKKGWELVEEFGVKKLKRR